MLRTSDLIMKDNPIVQYNGGNDDEEEEGTVEVLVSIPDRRVKVKVADEEKKSKRVLNSLSNETGSLPKCSVVTDGAIHPGLHVHVVVQKMDNAIH